MTDVYLRWEGEYEDRYVAAVYGSLEAALAAHSGHEPVWRNIGDRWTCDWGQEAVPPVAREIVFENLVHPVVDGVATLRDGRTVRVREGIATVIEPVLPDGYIPDFGTPARSCEFELERMTLVGPAVGSAVAPDPDRPE